MTLPAGLAPESQLLLLLARCALTPELEARARVLVASGIAWSGLARQAGEHGVFPLVCENLRRLGWEAVPGEVRTELMAASRLNAARNTLLSRDLIGLLRVFGNAGVPVIPLKGVTLAQSVYGDTSLRVCSDVDVLVPRDAVTEAFRLLLADGYEPAKGAGGELAQVERLLHSNKEYGFLGRVAGLEYLLELHWDIAWRWQADSRMVDDLWADARRMPVLGVEAWALSPEWEVLYLALHAARHRWSTLKWLVDVHELCVRGRFDWAGVEHRARRFGLERALHLTLGACRTLLGTPLPPMFAAHAPPRRLRMLRAAPVPIGGWLETLAAARLFSRPTDRLRYLGRLLFRPTLAEWSLIRLPSRLRFLYYGLRPLRVGLSSGRAMVRAGLGRLHS